ncbi:hypothetical protein HCTV-16_gp163 [Haloarcula virus HCTV-16]|nr:hypothetical protein HCTV-16_gp163 [Haloarcula virus HCTV-16]
MKASDSYISIVRNDEYTDPSNWLYHRDHRLESEARHAYWTEHLEEAFWDER